MSPLNRTANLFSTMGIPPNLDAGLAPVYLGADNCIVLISNIMTWMSSLLPQLPT